MTSIAPPRASAGDRAKEIFARSPALGPTAALIIALVFFSIATSTFLNLDNFTTIIAQTVVVSTLALGQTLVILTAGIDLANGAIMVFATVLIAKLSMQMASSPSVLIGIGVAGAVAAISGLLVTRLRLPPFIVTLGMLAVVTAVSALYSGGTTTDVSGDSTLTLLGKQITIGSVNISYGTVLAAILFVVMWLVLGKTGWGRHVYAVGNDSEAARLCGINVKKILLSVYVVAGIIYGIAAWMALGRSPSADPNAFQTGNLDSITAVVIGGTSLFGGRGGVVGTIVGALIVSVLRNGLTAMQIDSNYQNLATGVLVIAAVAFDQLTRRRSS
ncbi:fructose transport system permease protein [Nakamurella panacisegetis]|uniref:Fructose transport system permease protein n=1 Tax=Nakamurella panacisegetis TaxID=1090615 RepID=A0A1H0QKR6_9ACTN|nr:ABC transporter permease [Nakamurella panacisegetis]SDP17904.1 fructose transport system permease protein [Nakamurella panacisegetis]